MPYLKFSRDKRGYEHFSIVEPVVARRGRPSRPRVLFWFRTPPQVKVGRLPFTEDVRRAIEAQNPGVRFDWPRLLATPIPPPDAENWRERRRMEKAARQAAREADSEAGQGIPEIPGVPEVPDEVETDTGEAKPLQTATPLQASDSGERSHSAPAAAAGEPSAGGRRRRRRGRRRPRPAGETGAGGNGASANAPTVPVPPTEEV